MNIVKIRAVKVDGYLRVAVRFFIRKTMEVTGNKSLGTIIAEAQFKAIIKSCGGNYLYERTIHQTPKYSYQCPKRKKIDFVVGLPDENGNSIFVYTATGVELKTSMGNLTENMYGINFSCFRYNYLLVPEDISARTIKWMKQYESYKHVGILALCDSGEILVLKRAERLENDEKFDLTYKDILNEENSEGFDSVNYLFGDNNITAMVKRRI